jgi:DNA-binding CsgD family transcriptional regulator
VDARSPGRSTPPDNRTLRQRAGSERDRRRARLDGEQQILAWVARGKTNPEIAEILWITPSTLRKHLENVYAKLGVRTRTAAAARFLHVLPE